MHFCEVSYALCAAKQWNPDSLSRSQSNVAKARVSLRQRLVPSVGMAIPACHILSFQYLGWDGDRGFSSLRLMLARNVCALRDLASYLWMHIISLWFTCLTLLSSLWSSRTSWVCWGNSCRVTGTTYDHVATFIFCVSNSAIGVWLE